MHLDFAALVATYGYWALFAGTFLEGETVLILAGVAAHHGYLALPWVVATAFAGSLLGDQFFFFLGRRHASWILKRLDSWRLPLDVARRHLERHQVLIMIGFRFVYGIRMATPVVIGLSTIRAARFAFFNAVGAAVWATVVTGAGYLFGQAVTLILDKAQAVQLVVFGLVTVAALTAWGVRLVRRRRRRNAARPSSGSGDPGGPR